MPKVTIEIDENGSYTEPLKRRLADYNISHGALARESGIAPTQLSRWFNRTMEPQIGSVFTIEQAIQAILERRRRERESGSTVR